MRQPPISRPIGDPGAASSVAVTPTAAASAAGTSTAESVGQVAAPCEARGTL
jgi:hypothetical protein